MARPFAGTLGPPSPYPKRNCQPFGFRDTAQSHRKVVSPSSLGMCTKSGFGLREDYVKSSGSLRGTSWRFDRKYPDGAICIKSPTVATLSCLPGSATVPFLFLDLGCWCS
eukprot:7518582-Pyramimonas_sp.AAC.1